MFYVSRPISLSLSLSAAMVTMPHCSLNLSLATLAILSLISTFAIADVFNSIDCGSSDTYTDDDGIAWTGDDLYIRHGQSVAVKSPAAGSLSKAMTTLRAFDSSRKKNCYDLPVSGGGQVLVRASFYYGNYDSKSSPPSFALQIDGSEWATVVTSLDQAVSYEATYVVNGDATSVCVAQTQPNQLAFVSAIEVRSLETDMYGGVNESYALFLRRRVAFGAKQIVRFVDDPYDRIWNPSVVANGQTALVNDATFVNNSISDRPPAKVLQTAVAPASASASILLATNLPASDVPVYINFYFTEVTQLSSTDKRSFRIYADGAPISDAILPPYGGVSEFALSDVLANSSTSFALKATADSTLAPIISAMEVFIIGDAPKNGTRANDVEALGLLQQQFDVLQDWGGDPCLPASYNWEWVNCSDGDVPRITALYLSGFGLSGFLPDFSALDALKFIDLHNNSLNGEIPDFLGKLPNLQELNLADNSFSGAVPSSLTQNSKLKLDVSGNADLCTDQSCQSSSGSSSTLPSKGKKKSSKTGLVLGLTLPFSFLVCVAVAVVLFFQSKRRAQATAPIGTGTGVNGGHGSTPGAPAKPAATYGVQAQQPASGEDYRVEIERQMASEMADLMQQQVQAFMEQRSAASNPNEDEQALRY